MTVEHKGNVWLLALKLAACVAVAFAGMMSAILGAGARDWAAVVVGVPLFAYGVGSVAVAAKDFREGAGWRKT